MLAPSGTIYELTHILPWLLKHGTDPVTGKRLTRAELTTLHVARNAGGEPIDPVTFKVLTDNTHVVAIKPSGNVYAFDTVDRLNIKAKTWRDLVSDVEFVRADIVTLQDPANLASRDMSSFQYVKDGAAPVVGEGDEKDPLSGINAAAMGSSAKILAAKAAVAKARAEKAAGKPSSAAAAAALARKTGTGGGGAGGGGGAARENAANRARKALPYNAAVHTTGKAAASLTSTSLTPHVGSERALLSDEEYMLRPKRIKAKGYARIATNLGNLNIELHTETAPRTVYNFVQLAKKGYYKGVSFHRNVKNFMVSPSSSPPHLYAPLTPPLPQIQGGDPTGTGRGGTSYWGTPFNDELDGPHTHNGRGVISMANKGRNTNSSQFFILYRAAHHLDRKHTIFGRVVGGLDVLDALERVPVDANDAPTTPVLMKEVNVFVDPFEDFLKGREERQREEEEKRRRREVDGGEEEELITWTGKRVRDGTGAGKAKQEEEEEEEVGKYLKQAMEAREHGEVIGAGEDEIVEFVDEEPYEEPAKKKKKTGGGFGDFSSW